MRAWRQGLGIVCLFCGIARGQDVPSGWIDVSFGNYTTAYPGESHYDAGTFTVIGSGIDMWYAANDGGRFVFQPMRGDCEVTARVKQPTDTGLAYSARAGVLIQQQNTRGSLHMLFGWMRGDSGNVGRISASGRLSQGASPTSKSENGYLDEWLLMRLVRQGDTVCAYFKTNDVWILYHTLAVPMGEAVNAGIFVSRHTSSSLQLMTNEFDQVSVHQLVTVQTNETAGLDVSWVTDSPVLSNGWSYVYTLTRTPVGGEAETLATDLTDASYSDGSVTAGAFCHYAVTAVPVAQDGLESPPNVLIGTSAAVRLPGPSANLMSGLPQGLYTAYYSPTSAILPSLTQVEASVTNAAVAQPAGSTNSYMAVFNAGLTVEHTDLYTFFVDSDDGQRMWIGDTSVIDHWYGGRYLASSAPVWLEAGRSYPVRMAYFQISGVRSCTLEWRRAGDPDTIVTVPESAFTPVPLPWRHEDTGDVALNGNASFVSSTGAVTVVTAGNALTNAEDACHLVTRAATGDFDMTARLDSLTGTSDGRRAGLTARDDATSGSAGVMFLAVPEAGGYRLVITCRDTADSVPAVTSLVTAAAITDPLWLRLSCSGQTVQFAYRADAETAWTVAAEKRKPFATSSLFGLAASGDGAAATATFGVLRSGCYSRESLSPTQDAYIRSDNLNYGTSTELLLKRSGGDTQRETFLRFDVAGLKDARSALLRLYLQSRDMSNPPVQELVVRGLEDLDWDETTVSWTNAPGGLRVPTVFLAADDPTICARTNLPSGGQYLEFDVTQAVQASAAGTGDLTFDLYLIANMTGGTTCFSSKEISTAAYRPALVYTLDAPTGVTANGGPEAGNVTVAWSAYDGAAFYRVYRAADDDGPYAAVGDAVTNLCFKNTGLTSGQRYCYRVTAVTADGESVPSDTVSAAAPAGSTTQIVSGDTYIEGDGSTRTSGDTNYGTQTSLTVKYNAGALDYHREAYLLFNDIEGLGHVARAVLRITPSVASGGSVSPSDIFVQFFRMPSNTWSETTVTFNNPPPGVTPPTARITGAPLKDRVTVAGPVANTAMEVDVTEMVREAARVNTDNKLSIGIIRLDDLGAFNCVFYSKEDGGATARKPQLVYALGRPVAPDVSTSNGYMRVSWPSYRGASSYVIRRAETADGTYTTLTNTTETAFNDLTAEGGQSYYYTLAAVTGSGETDASLPAAVRFQVREERYPVADTYIENNGGTTTTTVHGSDTTLVVKRDPIREDFFKFDVRGLEHVANARFRACPSAQDSGFTPVNIILRSGDFGDWNESGVTYAAPPPGYAPPSTSTSAPGSNELARIYCAYKDQINQYDNFIEADVTETVRQAARDGKTYLTLFLTGDDTLQAGTGYMNVPAREYARLLKRPVLLCSGGGFTAPQALQAEAQADLSGFTLTWRPVSGAVRYVITRKGPTNETAVVVADDVTDTRYTDADASFWNDRAYTYTVTAVSADGTTTEASSVTANLARTFTRQVSADTFVQGGTSSNVIYGSSAVMGVKNDVVDTAREIYVRIGLDDLPQIVGATLNLTVQSINTDPAFTLVAEAVDDTGWTETGTSALTWTTARGAGAESTQAPAEPAANEAANRIDAATLSVGGVAAFDITSLVQSALAQAETTLVLHVYSADFGPLKMMWFHTCQAADLADVPSVTYTVAQNPAPGTVLLVR